jgi:hypothetical protein
MRSLLALLLFVPPLGALPAAAQETRRLEVDAGVGICGDQVSAPALSLRAAVDLWDVLSLGARVSGVVGGDASNYPTGPYHSGLQAWSLVPQLRLHGPWATVQPFAEAGLGFGQLVGEMGLDHEYTLTRGDAGVYWEAGLGVRALSGRATFTLEGLVATFSNVRGGNGTYLGNPTAAAEARRYSLPVYLLQFTVGFRSDH